MAGSRLELFLAAQDQTGPAFDSAARNARNLQDRTGELATGIGNLERIAGQARTTFVALGGALLLDKLLAFNREVSATKAALKDQADAVGLTTDELQAYQAGARNAGASSETLQRVLGTFNAATGQAAGGVKDVAQAFIDLKVPILDQNGNLRDNSVLLGETARALLAIENPGQRAAAAAAIFGKEGKQLTPVLRELAGGIDSLKASGFAAGQILDENAISTLNRLQNQSEATKVKIANLYAALAAPIEASGLEQVAKLLKIVNDEAERWGKQKGRVAEAVLSQQTTALQKQLADEEKLLAQQQDKQARSTPARAAQLEDQMATTRGRIAQLEERIAAATERQAIATARVAAIRSGHIDNPNDPDNIGISVTRGAGGANRFALPKDTGAAQRDRIAEEIAKLQGEASAAAAGLKVLQNARPGTLLTDLERAADLEKKIGDIVASSGKYKPSDARIQQLRDAATQAVLADQAFQKYKASLELADSTEAKFGDGKRQFAKTQADLNDALATGRLSQEAYTAAMIEATRAQEDQTAKSKQFAQGLEGIAAGYQYAAQQQARQNGAFQQGQQYFSLAKDTTRGFFSDFNRGLRDGSDLWATFANAGVNALGRISDKLMDMAVDNLFGNAFGGGGGGGFGGGLFGNLFGPADGFGGLFGGASFGGTSFADALAGGLIAVAKGGVFSGGKISAFANGGVVSSPTFFPMANGGTGLMGEAGPEAVMPLRRGPDGRLGVSNHGGGGGTTVIVHQTVQVGSIVSQAQHQQDLAMLRKSVTDSIVPTMLDAKKRGGAARAILKS